MPEILGAYKSGFGSKSRVSKLVFGYDFLKIVLVKYWNGWKSVK
jgi:hypothetical protein